MQENNMDSSKETLQGQENKETGVVLNTDKADIEAVDAEKLHDFKKAKRLKKSIKSMVTCNEKVQMYKETAEKFSALSGYENADELAKECRDLAESTNTKVITLTYKKAKEMMNAAKSSDDYKQAAAQFKKVKGYLDSDKLADECMKGIEKLEHRKSVKSAVSTVIAILCIIALILGARTTHAKYYMANTYMFTGSYTQAAKIYNKLGPYKDCAKRLTVCRYKSGLKYEKKEDYNNARKLFAKAGDYKDSDTRKVNMEIKLFQSSKVGDKVYIGNCAWKIIDIKNGCALLLRNKSIPEIPYNDESVQTTWESSTLRKWLNSDYLNKIFSKEEKKQIVLTNLKNEDNTNYGTEGGNDTSDYIFPLSASDAEKYADLLPHIKSYSWLRTPGSSNISAVFLTKNRKVMNYGYEVSSKEFNVQPALWFKFK